MKRTCFTLLLFLVVLGVPISVFSIAEHLDKVTFSTEVAEKDTPQILAHANDNENVKSVSPYFDVAMEKDSIYGIMYYDEKLQTMLLYGFTPDNPAELNPYKVKKSGADYNNMQVCAGAFANGYYYVFTYLSYSFERYPDKLGKINWETKEYEKIANWSGKSTYFSDMTYDYSTQTMYAIEDANPSNLLKVNLTNGNVEKVVALDDHYMTLACNLSGELYAVNNAGVLYKLDKDTGKRYQIGDTGVRFIQQYQSMDFNRSTGELYWAGFVMKNNVIPEGKLYKINTYNGTVTSMGQLGNNACFTALHSAFKLPNNEVPDKVSNLKATVSSEGMPPFVLTWKNPEKNYGKTDLTNLTAIDIYRNGTKIHTISSPVAGAEESWTDNTPEKGLNVYRLFPKNEVGEGLSLSTSAYYGGDVPRPVTEIKIEKVADGIKLSWEESSHSEGIMGGHIDEASLAYDITRLPDNVTIASGLKSTSFIDNTLTQGSIYSYKIQSRTIDGAGGVAVSAEIKGGPAMPTPYFCSFLKESEFKMWDIIDANKDQRTWEWWIFNSIEGAQCFANMDNLGADDWLISYPIKFSAGTSYKIKFKLQSRYGGEKLKITMGKTNKIEDQKTVLKTIKSAAETQYCEFALPEITESGNYCIGLYSCAEVPTKGSMVINDFMVLVDAPSNVSGIVKDAKGVPANGAKVFIKNQGGAVNKETDATGKYEFSKIESGSYTLTAEKFGYSIFEKELILSGSDLVENITLELLPKHSVTGVLKDINSVPLSGAKVSITGYDQYQAITDDNGSFTFPGVYQSKGYKLTVTKDRMETYYEEFDLEKDLVLNDILMKDRAMMPYNVIAKKENNELKVTWEAPKTPQVFRYDDGTPSESLGISAGSVTTVLGSIYNTPTILENMSWYLVKKETEHAVVNVFVFNLNENGMPDTLLYSKLNVPNVDNEWSSYTFPEPIVCPNGFMIGLSFSGFLSLGLDSGKSKDYPFQEKKNCVTFNFYSNEYTFLEDFPDVEKGNFMVRAEGTPLPVAKSPTSTSVPVYNVWRLKNGDEKNDKKWTLLTESPIKETSFIDNSWNSLEQDYYKYAVKTVFPSDVISAAYLSNNIDKDMKTKVVLNVKTNTPVNKAEGAIATLTHSKDTYTATVGSDGKAIFEMVEKQIYDLKIEQVGYGTFVKNGLDFSKDGLYETEVYELTEKKVTPYNLGVYPNSISSEYSFKWNQVVNLFDNFESYDNFTVNPSGANGWSYIDGDNSGGYGLNGTEFPHNGGKMAYIVFNPSATNPPLKDFDAYSGEKYLAGFVATEGPNADFIISPELQFPVDFTLSFYAKTVVAKYGLETIKVGYSLTGKEMDDFIWLIDGVQTPPTWAKFRYTIPADAKYVAIQYVSSDIYMVGIDDIFIGIEKEFEYPKSSAIYEVYLDGNKVGETKDLQYILKDMSEGKHVAGVKAVYDSGSTEIVNVNFNVVISGIENNSSDNVFVYPNPVKDKLFIKGNYDKVEVYNAAGSRVLVQGIADYVSMSALENGVYFVRVTDKNTTTVHKVIVKK